jgi:nucleotidyltransferase/DNA polymerase involved in DNA repair
MIGCILVPYFAAAVERREDPSLAGESLVICELSGDSEKVFAVSGEAAQVGVEPGMTLRQAQILCSQACFIPADPERYQRAFDQFLNALANFTSHLEPGDLYPSAISWLDLGHLKWTEAVEMIRCLGQTLRRQTHLAPAIGLASGKFPAYVAATSVEPNKARIIASGRETAFLAPFPVDFLPLDREMSRHLRLLGIRTLGQLAALPPSAVLAQFGTSGQLLHQLAQGQDNRPVLLRRPEATEVASYQFDGPIANQAALETVTQTLAVELVGRLQSRGLISRELRLILYLEGRDVWQERLVMRQPTSNPQRLTRTLTELVARAQARSGIIGLEVILTGLIPTTGQQLDLFTHRAEQERRLHQMLKDLVVRYGADCFCRVSLFDREIPLPERRFWLQEVEPL